MQTDGSLNINENRMQCIRGGSVIPSKRVSTYKVIDNYPWPKHCQLLPSMMTVGSI